MYFVPENHQWAPFLLKQRGFLQQYNPMPSLMRTNIQQYLPWQPIQAWRKYHQQMTIMPSRVVGQTSECLQVVRYIFTQPINTLHVQNITDMVMYTLTSLLLTSDCILLDTTTLTWFDVIKCTTRTNKAYRYYCKDVSF